MHEPQISKLSQVFIFFTSLFKQIYTEIREARPFNHARDLVQGVHKLTGHIRCDILLKIAFFQPGGIACRYDDVFSAYFLGISPSLARLENRGSE